MTSSCIKTSCASILVLLLMVLTATEGARIPRASGNSKHMVGLQVDPDALTPMHAARALHNSSISPWTYNTTHDQSLYPPSISEARCLLKGCLDMDGQENRSLESRPIMHEVLLVRRVRPSHSSHPYHFKLERRLIAVACTCVKPVVVQHQ
ncbi:interleukin-17F-like [Eucyclogobius newberryi]|uniref:interleukin-17F-like n=1 Tax=Eucyclogobius newberryi TaxID=166745 RepID=UPI003B5AB0E1